MKQEFEIKKGLCENPEEWVSTSLYTHIETTYAKLKKLLGLPHTNGDGYKVDAEWEIRINDKPITIYNYKDGKNYNGKRGLPKTKITDWHIGSVDGNVSEEVAFLIKKLKETLC